MQVLTPTYTLRIEIFDSLEGGRTKYYRSTEGISGCDEVLATVKNALESAGIEHATIMLERFEHK